MSKAEMSLAAPAELGALAELSARLGHDELLTQGSGGNTSIKVDGTLWVKASGLWLAEATDRPSFVPIDIACLCEGLRAQVDDPVGAAQFKIGQPDIDRLRPSIEASMHAVIPQAVVLHLHSIATIAHAVRQDAEEQLAHKLFGLAWCFLPYVRPGLALCRELVSAADRGPFDVFVLGNHGLTVAAADCEKALALLQDVERRLACQPRALPPAHPERLAALLPLLYRLPRDARCHRLAADNAISAWAVAGSLYPDHAVFLGHAVSIASSANLGQWLAEQTQPPLVIIVPGEGVLVSTQLSDGAEAMLVALTLVLERLAPDTPLNWLPDGEVADLVNWDAERYRRALDKARLATTDKRQSGTSSAN
jgi:rhamnose utilization protein RhaD (predicted bifunctional aldolase and dehydrogenase)